MSSYNFQKNSDLLALNKSIKFMEKIIYDLKRKIQMQEVLRPLHDIKTKQNEYEANYV